MHIQSCPTLCHPMDCSPPSPWDFPERKLEWVVIPLSSWSSWPKIEPVFPASPALGFFITEPPGKPTEVLKYLILGLFRKLYICLFSSVLVKKFFFTIRQLLIQEIWFSVHIHLLITLQSPLECKEIKSVNPKRNQSWLYIIRTVAKANAPILWTHDGKNQLTGKTFWCWESLKGKGEASSRGWGG